MPKQNQEPAEILPSLSKEQGKQALAVMKAKGETFLANRPIQKAAFDTWSNSTFDYIEKTYGSRIGHFHAGNFAGPQQIQVVGSGGGHNEQHLETLRADRGMHLTQPNTIACGDAPKTHTELARLARLAVPAGKTACRAKRRFGG